METAVIYVTILGIISGATGQQVDMEPVVFSYPGQTVNLSCAFTDATGIHIFAVTWLYESKEGESISIAVFVPNNDPTYPNSAVKGRVSFSPSPPTLTNPSIQIRDVRMSDEGKYICRYGTTNGNKEGFTFLDMLGATGQQVDVEPKVFSYPGQTVNLRCALTDATGINIFAVSWLYESKEGERINIAVFAPNTGPSYPNSTVMGRVSFSPSPPSLTSPSIQIRDVRMSDEGNYICQYATFPDGNRQGITFLDMLEQVANVTVTNSSTDLMESSSVRLSCSSSGSSLSFLWLNGSSEVTASDRVQLTDGNTTLTIDSVTRYDQGPFRCHVFNAVSNGTSAPVLLSISFGPENINLTISPSQEYYVEGSDISLSCSAVSRPAALFNWSLNGDLLSDTGPELRLKNVQENQSGTYSCQAFNDKTMRNQTSQPSAVFVLEKIAIASVTSSTNQAVEGNSVNLTCEAAGSVFTRKWMKNGADLNQTDNMILYNDSRVLSFQSLKKTDSGKYSCIISNPLSSDEAEYIMIVNYGPENVEITGPTKTEEEQTIILICSVESTPPANYTWILNGKEILRDSAILIKTMRTSSDSGQYICQARNHVTGRTSSGEHRLFVKELGGLSAGAIAGIVVSCLLGTGGALGGGFYIYKNKFKSSAPSHERDQEENVYENTE